MQGEGCSLGIQALRYPVSPGYLHRSIDDGTPKLHNFFR